MKQLYFLSSFLLFTVAAFSQQKPEFGFVVKAGSFTLPGKKNMYDNLNTNTYRPGTSFSFGTFIMQPLGGHFGISAEILYNFSAYREQQQYNYEGYYNIKYWSTTDRHFDVQSFMFPLKMYFRIKRDGRFSMYAGATPGFILGSNLRTNYRYYDGTSYSTSEKNRVVRKDGSEGVQLFFTAGGHYLINRKTSIGLEFTGNFKRNSMEHNYYPGSFFCGEVLEPMYTYWMKSFAISLRHNILR